MTNRNAEEMILEVARQLDLGATRKSIVLNVLSNDNVSVDTAALAYKAGSLLHAERKARK